MNKKIMAIGIMGMFLLMGLVSVSAVETKTEASMKTGNTTIYVDDDNTEGPWDGTEEHPYQHIQDGIDAAQPGDNILVKNGEYESFSIQQDKSQLKVHGEDRDNVIINGVEDRSVIYIYSDKVEISGFTIQNGYEGIYLRTSHDCIISDNIIKSNGIIESNSEAYGVGIFILGVDDESSCSGNVITANIISNNIEQGISLWHADGNTISGNTISENGICTETLNREGLFLWASEGNTIIENTFINNYGGCIYLWHDTSNNNIYHNNFTADSPFKNTPHDDTGDNNWENDEEGNYWDDYTGKDIFPRDGIGDTPYIFDGGQDNYPLMKPYGEKTKSKALVNPLFNQLLEKLLNRFPPLARLLQLPFFMDC